MKVNRGSWKERTERSGPLNGKFSLPKIGESLFAGGKSARSVYLTELALGRILY
jgi:hypothetical protein